MSLPLEQAHLRRVIKTYLQRKIGNVDAGSTHSYKEGQIAPVLEHSNCSGLKGKVQDGHIVCTQCDKVVMPDNRQSRRESSTHRS